MDLKEYAKGTNSYINGHIKLGDAKAGSIIGFTGLLAGALTPQVFKFLPLIFEKSVCWGIPITFVLGLLVISISLVFISCFSALSPRVPKAEKSLNSFPDIASFSNHSEYQNAMEELLTKQSNNPDKDMITENLNIHNWVLSQVAMDKFKDISNALNYLKVTFFFVGILFVTVLTATLILKI